MSGTKPPDPKKKKNLTRAGAARANGKKSHGPRTPEGKARCSLNGFKHGLRPGRVVIPGESLDIYNTLPDPHVVQALVYQEMHTRSRLLEENRRAESRFHREYERSFRLLEII